MSKAPKLSDIKIVEKDWMPEGKFALVPPNQEKMSKQPDRYSQLDGYLRAYYFFKDVLTDNRYNARPLTIEESEHWLNNIQEDIDKFEKEIEQL